MTCAQIQIAVSALLDGESPGVPAGTVTAHLAGCPQCRAWQTSAEEVTRAVRLRSVEVPDLTVAVLAAVAADDAPEAARRAAAARGRRQVLRVALAVSAVAQLLFVLPALVSSASGGAVHVSREMASFDVAFAVGYLFAAWRPARAAALVPIALVLALCIAFGSAFDVANNNAALGHEVSHLLIVLQAALLWALRRPASGPRPAVGGGSVRAAA